MLCFDADIISFATNRPPPQELDAQLAKEHGTDNSSISEVGRRLLPSASIVDEQQCSHSRAFLLIEFGPFSWGSTGMHHTHYAVVLQTS